MDNLEQFINDNREGFDIYEPAPMSFERVKLRDREFTIRVQRRTLLRVAAAVAVLISGALAYSNFPIATDTNSLATNTVTVDVFDAGIEETEAYYEDQIATKLVEVERHLGNYPDLRNDLRSDLTELDSIYVDLKEDLKDGIGNEDIVEAMIQNYRMKIKILEDIMFFIQQDKSGANRQISNNEITTYEL